MFRNEGSLKLGPGDASTAPQGIRVSFSLDGLTLASGQQQLSGKALGCHC